MREIETDYLVVGAGASGMAFTDALIADSDAEVVIVDRRHRPGGHWVDAYPFVRLHQPSACYGVTSRALGSERIDETGPNAGFYERSTAAEICAYYDRVLEEHLLPSNQVRFLGMSDYLGNGVDGHTVVSTVSGERTTIKVRRKLVDTTYTEGTIPSRHTPAFEVDPDVRLVPPNDLVKLSEPASGYTVIGAGKTAMDTCCWLMEQGVPPDRIRWIRARDPWAIERAAFQPLALVASAVELQSRMVEAAAESASTREIFHRLEAHGFVHRIDRNVEPDVFRGATLSGSEMRALREIDNVVRLGRVLRLSTSEVILDRGSLASHPGHLYVDCSASALKRPPVRPVFEADRITTEMVTFGVVPWSAATLGYVEATRDADLEKNRLCPPVGFTGELDEMTRAFYWGFKGAAMRMDEPDLAAWNQGCRLNPFRAAFDHLDDPRVSEGFARFGSNMEPALANLERMLGDHVSAVPGAAAPVPAV